jgi:hypothetical protein
MNLHSFSLTVIILLLVVFAAVIWLVLRGLGFLRFSRVENVLAGSAPVGDKVSAIAEAIILLCVGGIIFIFTATNTSTGGRMLILDELHPVFAGVNLTVAVCAGVCLLLSVLVCFFRRTSVATILAAFILIVYGFLLNGPGEPLEKMAGEEATERQVTWTINMGGCDVEGAELWVNGNRLGTLPYKTTPEEFKSKVPFWAEAPAEMQNREDFWKVPEYSPCRVNPPNTGAEANEIVKKKENLGHIMHRSSMVMSGDTPAAEAVVAEEENIFITQTPL